MKKYTRDEIEKIAIEKYGKDYEMLQGQITEILIMYNDYLNFEYAQFGLDEQDIEEFIKYYNKI